MMGSVLSSSESQRRASVYLDPRWATTGIAIRSAASNEVCCTNAFSLYDMLGNVAEMTDDCWEPNYINAPNDGSSWHAGECAGRVNRGDTWTSTPGELRSAARGFDDPTLTRVVDLGFRVARN